MDLMDRPKTRRARHEPDPAGMDKEAQAEAERAFWSIEDEKIRVELIGGEVIVNASPAKWHQRVVARLCRFLDPACDDRGLELYPDMDVIMAATDEIFRPDLTVARDEDTDSGDERVPAECALLVVEIASASTRRRDLEVKRRSYAKNGVPLYMIIDRFVEPPAVTLLSEPGDRDYTDVTTATFGPGGDKLELPEPFNVTLDLSAIPAPPR
jgi:Uma2 family endonuclease